MSVMVCLLQLLLVTGSLAANSEWWQCNNQFVQCVRTVAPTEELIVQLYPGLFSPTPPESRVPDMTGSGSSIVNSETADKTSSSKSNGTGSNTKPKLWEGDTIKGQKTSVLTSDCCETEIDYITPANVMISGQTYNVVHLQNESQFIPIGKCREGSKCSYGECVEQNRAHWVLVYNSSKSNTGPPVSFAAIEVPSHCQCWNVGRP